MTGTNLEKSLLGNQHEPSIAHNIEQAPDAGLWPSDVANNDVGLDILADGGGAGDPFLNESVAGPAATGQPLGEDVLWGGYKHDGDKTIASPCKPDDGPGNIADNRLALADVDVDGARQGITQAVRLPPKRKLARCDCRPEHLFGDRVAIFIRRRRACDHASREDNRRIVGACCAGARDQRILATAAWPDQQNEATWFDLTWTRF